jgi:hypothetical protein
LLLPNKKQKPKILIAGVTDCAFRVMQLTKPLVTVEKTNAEYKENAERGVEIDLIALEK